MAVGAKEPAQKKDLYEKELAADKKARVAKLTISAVEREKIRRQRRVKERKEREAALKKILEEREREGMERLKQSASVLLRSAKLHSTTVQERDRVTLFRRKQNAAITIQRHWRVWHYKRLQFVDSKQSRHRGTSKEAPRHLTKGCTEGSEAGGGGKEVAAKIRRRSVEAINAFRDFSNPPLQKSVAALTIQLFWRQFKRKKIQRLTTEKKQTYKEEMAEERRRDKQKAKAITKMRKEFSREAEKRRALSGRSLFPPAPLTLKRQVSVYRKRAAPHVYHAPKPITMQRPLYLETRPSPAESSFNFAVGSYTGFHKGNLRAFQRRGSADATRSPSRRGLRPPGKLARSPEKPLFAF